MEDRKEPQQMLPLRNEGHREPRKRKPERGASREGHWTVGHQPGWQPQVMGQDWGKGRW